MPKQVGKLLRFIETFFECDEDGNEELFTKPSM